MKVVDIDRVVILMRFIQYGWDEERKKRFDDNLRMMLETQCEDLEEHDKQIVKETLDKVWKKAISMHDDYVELEELDNYIDEIIEEIK